MATTCHLVLVEERYSLAEIKLLLKEWLDSEDNIAGSEELMLDWRLSCFVEWLAKREQGKEGDSGRR